MSDVTQQNYQTQNLAVEAAFSALIVKMSKDMSFLGIVAIVGGALACLSIIGAAFGIPVIFAGMRLRESADAFKNYSYNNDPMMLHQAIEKQSRYFFIYKVLVIIYLALVGIYLIVLLIIILAAGTAIVNNY
ncbi:MAG: DUF5362 domain-containing protein [Ignavibacteriae bacterium]|nr:DUF5362 domain-containing protein [Ignavibacteriota bacterium]